MRPQHLYQHNFFGPALVEQIGRERVLNAPAWQVRSFEDGATLVIPNDLYGDEQVDHMPAVAEALGLPYDAQALSRYLERLRSHRRP